MYQVQVPRFPFASQKHLGRWTGDVELSLGVNVCVNLCVCILPVKEWHPMRCVFLPGLLLPVFPKKGLKFTVTLNRCKDLQKI